MTDALSVLQTLSTVTSTDNGTALNTRNGVAIRGAHARFIITSALATSSGASAGVVLPKIQASATSGGTYRDIAVGKAITLSNTAQTAIQDIIFSPPQDEEYVKSVLLVTANNSTGISVSYQADVVDGRPFPMGGA